MLEVVLIQPPADHGLNCIRPEGRHARDRVGSVTTFTNRPDVGKRYVHLQFAQPVVEFGALAHGSRGPS